MTTNPTALSIRAKKLGVLIRDARLAGGKTLEACAASVSVTSAEFEDYELGTKSPSLPQLEVLASFLNVPLERFWANKTLSVDSASHGGPAPEKVIGLRQRIIGALLRRSRLEAGLSLEALAEKSASSPQLLETYELGEAPIPLPDLEMLSKVLNRSMDDFQVRRPASGVLPAQPRVVQDFLALSSDLQTFVSKPVNQPYLEIAQRLSEMPAEKLRSVAEGLLAITL
ncbi:MAG TPA: helix-turn-helix transcriptional regulator [Anaerolineales bacterium]